MRANPKLECCAAMRHAQENGTDNECYGRAVWTGSAGEWLIGTGLPNITFCPWCGKAVPQ